MFWGATPEPKQTFFGLVQLNHSHHRYPRTLLLAYRVQRYGCLGRYPKTQTIVFVHYVVQFKQPHHRYPKTFLLSYRAQWHGCCPATPEPKQYVSVLCSSNTRIIGIQKYFCWPVGYRGMGVQTPPSKVSKNNFAGATEG